MPVNPKVISRPSGAPEPPSPVQETELEALGFSKPEDSADDTNAKADALIAMARRMKQLASEKRAPGPSKITPTGDPDDPRFKGSLKTVWTTGGHWQDVV